MVKKKSKFRHISISNKKYYFYEIKWWDILGDSGHAGIKEFDNMTMYQLYVVRKELLKRIK